MLIYITTKSLPVFCALPDIKQNDKAPFGFLLCSAHFRQSPPQLSCARQPHNPHCGQPFNVFMIVLHLCMCPQRSINTAQLTWCILIRVGLSEAMYSTDASRKVRVRDKTGSILMKMKMGNYSNESVSMFQFRLICVITVIASQCFINWAVDL